MAQLYIGPLDNTRAVAEEACGPRAPREADPSRRGRKSRITTLPPPHGRGAFLGLRRAKGNPPVGRGNRMRLAWALLMLPIAFGCTVATRLNPAEEVSPRARAERIYERLLTRYVGSAARPPEALAGFPDAPTGIARRLEALAAAAEGQEREELVALGEALRGTGLYSRVLFRTKPEGGTVKYRPVARGDAKTAHVGWNILPIGFYHVWSERNGHTTSELFEYEVIQTKLVIVVSEHVKE